MVASRAALYQFGADRHELAASSGWPWHERNDLVPGDCLGAVTSIARPVTITDYPDEVAASMSSISNATIASLTLRVTVASAAVGSTISS
jgi:hypothetical protein